MRRIWATMGALLLAGCGSGGITGGFDGDELRARVDRGVSPVDPGQQVTYQITLQSKRFLSSDVRVEVQVPDQAGLAVVYDPAVIPSSSAGGRFSIQTSAATPAGTYAGTVRMWEEQYPDSRFETAIEFEVSATTPAGSWNVTVLPEFRILTSPSSSADFTFEIQSTGYQGPLTISVTSLHSAVAISQGPAPQSVNLSNGQTVSGTFRAFWQFPVPYNTDVPVIIRTTGQGPTAPEVTRQITIRLVPS